MYFSIYSWKDEAGHSWNVFDHWSNTVRVVDMRLSNHKINDDLSDNGQ